MSRAPGALVLLGHLLLALAASWPLAAHWRSQLIGHPEADSWNHAWGLWWFWEELSAGSLPWRSDWVYAPEGGVLWFIDPLGGLLGAPLVPLLGVVGAYNTVVVADLTLASLGAWALARQWGAGQAAWLASLGMVSSAFLLSELHSGITEVLKIGPVLLALAALQGALREGGRWRWTLTALAAMWAALGTFYYGLAFGLVALVLGAFWLRRRPERQALLQAATAGLCVLAFVATLGLLIQSSLSAEDALIERHDGHLTQVMLRHNVVDLRSFFWIGGFQSVDHSALGEAFLHSGYLGWSTLIMALWTLRRRPELRPWGWAALLLVTLAAGPWLYLGERILIGGEPVPLPMWLLYWIVPPQALTHTLRFLGPALGILLGLAALGWLRWGRRGLAAGALLLLTEAWLSQAPWPLVSSPALDTRAHEALAHQGEEPVSERKSILDLPASVGNSMATSRYFLYQPHHRRPLPYRPDARGSSAALIDRPLFRLLTLASEYRPPERPGLMETLQESSELDPRDLSEAGVGWVVVHRDLDQGGEKIALTEELLRALFGRPEVTGHHAVYTVRAGEPVPLQGRWRRALQQIPDGVPWLENQRRLRLERRERALQRQGKSPRR